VYFGATAANHTARILLASGETAVRQA
jgi:hypothetical protein